MHSLQRPKSSSCTVSNSDSSPRASKREPLFFDDVQADQSQIADVFLHQIRDVVVANEQHVERHVLAVAHQLIFAAAVFQAAARQQIQRVVGETAAFLNGDLQAHRVVAWLGATH